jgi:AcrR family transcriptional regulator
MRKRAENVDETRLRIVEAVVGLHGSVGPAETTIADIAREAGVTRLTVYRHFPDVDSLFGACSAHWQSQQTLPDPGSWSQTADAGERVRVALTDIYRFYRDGASMLTRLYHDKETIPPRFQTMLDERDVHWRELLLQPFRARGHARRRLRAVLGHAVSFWTWRSLCAENGLSDAEAVDAMMTVITQTAPAVRAAPS